MPPPISASCYRVRVRLEGRVVSPVIVAVNLDEARDKALVLFDGTVEAVELEHRVTMHPPRRKS